MTKEKITLSSITVDAQILPNNTLDAKGGVNAPLAICLGVCYLIILNLPLWLL